MIGNKKLKEFLDLPEIKFIERKEKTIKLCMDIKARKKFATLIELKLSSLKEAREIERYYLIKHGVDLYVKNKRK